MVRQYRFVITDEELEELLRVALTRWPLYRELNYTNLPERVAVPKLVTLHCPTCRKEQIWETDIALPAQYDQVGENNKRGFWQKTYTCRNCGDERVTYYFYWMANAQGQSTFYKVGQFPELEETVSAPLEKALDA